MSFRTISLLVGLSFFGLAACGGGGSSNPDDDLGPIAKAQEAASNIKSSTDAVDACSRDNDNFQKDSECNTGIDSLTSSAFNQMDPHLPELDMVQLETAITTAVEYAVEANQRYPDIDFSYSDPNGSAGSTVTINEAMTGERLKSSQPRPVINHDQGVYADENEPAAAPKGKPGWYFHNDTAGSKVNWYMYGDNGSSVTHTIQDLRSLQARVTHYADVDNFNYFFHVYTKAENDIDDCAAWYRSRVTLVATNASVQSSGTSSLIQYDRDDNLSGGDVEYEVGGTTKFSSSSCDSSGTISDINEEEIFLISFSTNSGASTDEVKILLEEMTLGFSGGEEKVIPVHAADAPDENFTTAVPNNATSYVEIASQTDIFDGLVLKLDGGRSTYEVSRTDGEDMTVAQTVLLEKLDRGDAYNALVPAPAFDPDAETLVFDFGADMARKDLANLQAEVYSDAARTNKQSTITIDSKGDAVTVTTP